MAAGDFLLDATGRRVLDSTGRQQLSNGVDDSCTSDPCDCPSGGAACARCIITLADCTPTTIQATVSGISACTGCHEYRNPGPTGKYVKLDGDPNGVWCLPRVGASCTWQLTSTGVYIREYSNASCTALVAVTEMGITYARTLTGATETLNFVMQGNTIISGVPTVPAAAFFENDDSASVGPTPGCVVASTASIITGSCGDNQGGIGPKLGIGGTATFDACC
jgi:hypothetical protein